MMKPFMYYVLNKYDIETYLTIELNGVDPHLTKRELLRSPVKHFIESHIDGVDKKSLDEYVSYICDHVSYVRD